MTSSTLESADRTGVSDSTGNLSGSEEPADGFSEPERISVATRLVRHVRRSDSRSAWQVLAQRDFRRYFLGSLISNLGTWLQSTAQVLIAYRVTHSVFMVGLIASAQFAGMMVSPWAPVLADRLSPRAVLVGTQGFSALIAGLMAWRYHDGLLGVHTLLVGALGLGFAFALALPVQTALVPALVREEDAADAIKMNSVCYNAGRALAPALCVPVIIFIGPDLIFALNGLSFVIFVIILCNLPHLARTTSSAPADDTSATRPRARVRDGFKAALMRRRLLLLLAIVAAVTLADDPILVLSPAVAARLHMSSASAGYFIAALGWGSVLGSLPPTSVRGNTAQHASRRAAISLLVLGGSMVVFAAGFWSPASLIAASVAGAAALYSGTAAQTALLRHQQSTGADVASVAGVAALWAIAWAGTKPFASLLDGWLAVHIGIVVTGIVLILPAVSIALCELNLSDDVKRTINDWGERTACRIVQFIGKLGRWWRWRPRSTAARSGVGSQMRVWSGGWPAREFEDGVNASGRGYVLPQDAAVVLAMLLELAIQRLGYRPAGLDLRREDRVGDIDQRPLQQPSQLCPKPGPLAIQGRAQPGELPPPVFRRQLERPAQPAALGQLGQPQRVLPVGLGPARYIAGMAGALQQHLQPGCRQDHEPDPLGVVGRFQHDHLDPLSPQVITQLYDRGRDDPLVRLLLLLFLLLLGDFLRFLHDSEHHLDAHAADSAGCPGDPVGNGNLTGVLIAAMRDLSRSGPDPLTIGRTQLSGTVDPYNGQPVPGRNFASE